MKQELLLKEKESRFQEPSTDIRRDSDEAIKRIYEQYGSDLSAFLRDAYREAGHELQSIRGVAPVPANSAALRGKNESEA